jgi:hypothetical protein
MRWIDPGADVRRRLFADQIDVFEAAAGHQGAKLLFARSRTDDQGGHFMPASLQ